MNTTATFHRLLMCVPFCLLLALRPTTAGTADQPRYEPTEHYETRDVEGWTIRVHRSLLQEQTQLADRVFILLRQQLFQVTRRVPAEALKKLQSIPIWIEGVERHHPCMAYHPSPEWLLEHDMNPDKAGCVEIANAENFLKWTIDQPWMVLHELAHGYHHQFLEGGFQNPDVKQAFDHAMAADRYKSVLRIGGTEERAYAATNPQEYFAEASEAFFGTNDFYPFVRAELKRHDPDCFDTLETLWGRK